jgi:hypothetical protein
MGFTVTWTRIATDSDTFYKFAKDLHKVIRYSSLEPRQDALALHDREDRSETFVASIRGDSFAESFCKTSRTYFTYDVMDACILMKHYGMAIDLHNDDEREFPWEREYDRVKEVLGWGSESEMKDLEIAALKKQNQRLQDKLTLMKVKIENLLSLAQTNYETP